MLKLKKWLNPEPFSLALSAGFFGFYAHCGFVKALFEEGHRPQRIMGSSAGALLGSLIATGYSIEEVEKIITQFRKSDFWDLKPGLGLLEGDKFRKLLEKFLPQSFDELKVPLSVAAHPLLGLQAKNFSDGDLVSAVHASCCFPGMFHPVKIENQLFIDGGVTDWVGSKCAKKNERVLVHYLKPSGPHSLYIQMQVFKTLKKHHHVVTLPNLLELGPTKMDQGHEAIQESYLKTLELLKG